MEELQELAIETFLSSSAGESLKQTLDTITLVQQDLIALAESEDSRQLDLLKIGSTLQLFLIDTLASGKSPRDLTKDDWRSIAEKVSKHAVLEERQCYSEFVFTLYADYIDLSVKKFQWTAKQLNLKTDNGRLGAISALSSEIRAASVLLQDEQEKETEYVEKCLWLSLEAMIKLLSYWFSSKIALAAPDEYAKLAQSISDLAFEYGRYVLYAKEQAILSAYIKNQYTLDDDLRAQYEAFLAELKEQSAQFQGLIDAAFSSDIHEALLQSAALARAAGVKEEEVLRTIEDIDSFFMD